MKTKIFFTDLDSTLLTREKQVSPLTYETLKNWTESGHKLVLCSGRALDSVAHVRESLGLTFPNMYLIGCNGGEIYDCEKKEQLLRLSLSRETAVELFSLAKEWDIYIHTYTDTHILTARECDELTFYRRAIHTPYLLTDNILEHLEKEPCKCLSISLDDLQKLENFRKVVLEKTGDKLTVLYSNPHYLELFPASSGKGTGLKWLCEYLNIPVANSLAAGDELNDISMIEAAGLGIAMKNAREEVKEIADIITGEDNNHDGLVPILKTAMES
ncbi:MAG: HAD family phosphatase [Lachnospiraceae bacterium]|nr:HAD family phosphatase [Lachnospiraceae bacterium]